MIRLTVTDKKLAKNKAVKKWLRECEKLVNAKVLDDLIELQTVGSVIIGRKP
mgnify:CR=1 FL=1